MENISQQISSARKTIVKASETINKALQRIKESQSKCPHKWRFNRQINAYHEEHWWVTKKCSDCDLEEVERKHPVCEDCDATLERAKPDDSEAAKYLIQVGYERFENPPIAFRCPKCQKIHVLRILGD